MENPFLKRATEHVRDSLAFLAVVTPEPVSRFLKNYAQTGALYDRPVLICGTPGSGKTTLARMFEFSSISTLLKVGPQRGIEEPFRDLAAAMTDCKVIQDGQPTIVGCRLQLETDYRDFWECPYPEKLKTRLMTSLLQARSVLAWLRLLEASGISQKDIFIVPREDAGASVDAIGGIAATDIIERAREVENSIYQIVGALVPPPHEKLSEMTTGAYQPFDVIESIRVKWNESQITLKPLAIFDDAHELHSDQYKDLLKWLARRELRIARWMLTRFDVLTSGEALSAASQVMTDEDQKYPGLKGEREVIRILLQKGGDRSEQRKAFRRMARDMANRYIRQWPLFNERGLTKFSHLLSTELPPISEKVCEQLSNETEKVQRKLKITDRRKKELEEEAISYLQNSKIGGQSTNYFSDIMHAMLQILMHRYSKRIKGPTLFPGDDPEPSRPVRANSSVFDSACLHLLHKNGRPYFYGIDKLCDCGSENAELFLHLAGSLAERSATQLIKQNRAELTPKSQNQRLRDRASEIINDWNFPWHNQVRKLINFIGELCVNTTLEPNAWLSPNSYGVPQSEFNGIVDSYPELASVLQFAIARNAISINPEQSCKGKQWCVIELSGLSILKYGLTLNRGGFIEGTLSQVSNVIQRSPDV